MATSHKLRAKAASKSVRRHYAVLASVINPLKLAQELFSAEVIDSSTMGMVRSTGVTREEKAHDVLSAVFNVLETNPNAFDALCNALSSEAASEDIARKLKAEYEAILKDLVAARAPSRRPAIDHTFKIVVIGDCSVGKTCLMRQFIDGKFPQRCPATTGVEFGSKVVDVASKSIKLEVWDTVGQERFRSITRSYYRGAAGALLVYDISRQSTFHALTEWLPDIQTHNVVTIVVGNKTDLEDNRQVDFQAAKKFAHENGLVYFETSAIKDENVEEVFIECTKLILYHKGSTNQSSGGYTLSHNPPRKRDGRKYCNC